MRAECRNCDTFLLSTPGGFAHHRKTSACDRPEPDFPEDPALAGLPVHWVIEEDGALRRATPEDQPAL
jgi:hypothetical protein